MSWRFILLLVVIPITACSKPPEPRSDKAKLASDFIDRVEQDVRYRMGIRPDIEKEQLQDLLTGSIELLQGGSPAEKSKSARFLGRLGNPAGIAPLVQALGDPQEAVRAAACFALQWLGAKGETVDPVLAKLCREDPSIAVRVAAAVALQGGNEKDAVTAFQLGLQSRNQSLWEICEDGLEKRGKLELPLPDHVYTEISHKRYQEIKADSWYSVQRETTKNGTIYLEVVERVKHAPLHRDWYKSRVGQ